MSEVITNHLDLWTSALLNKSSAGRGSNRKLEAYGIKKLRELILELAVRGKLVAQDPNDEPANVLLERIAEAKARLLKEDGIKKDKLLSKIGEEEKLYELPNGWGWARLQDLSSYIQRGKGPQYADYGKVRVVSQKCVQWTGFDLSQARYVGDDSLESYQPERFLRYEDLLWNSTGTGTVGRTNVVPEVEANSLVADSHVTVIRPLMVNSNFMRCYISAPGIQQRIEPEHENSLVSGTTKQVELNLSAVIQLVVPVPPIAEQFRIVAKVDELMGLCDQLVQQQIDGIDTHQTLVGTQLGTLTHVASPQDLTEAWARIASNFDALFTTEQSIDQLRQTILQLAVMGKLVPQDPDDEPADVLLNRYATEKDRVVSDKKIRKQKATPAISDEGLPFEVPMGWEWERLGNLAIQITDGTHHTPDYLERGIPFISVKDIDGRTISFDDCKYISKKQHEEINARCNPEYGDLLICRIGTLGRATIVDTRKPFSLFVSVGLLKFIQDYLIPKYIHIVLHSPLLVNQYDEIKAGGSHTNKLNLSDLPRLLIPVAPVAEQHRIVAKVEELMDLCDALKVCFVDASNTQIYLANAIVEQATA